MTRRRGILLGASTVLLLALNGCGWTPLYADIESGPGDEELRALYIAPIPERLGQRLAIALRSSLSSLGPASPTRYLLRVTLQTIRQDLGVVVQGLGTRGKLDVYATIKIEDSATHAELYSATTHVAESFDIVANEYSALVAEDDARTRSAEELRRDIMTRLQLWAQKRAAERAATTPAKPAPAAPIPAAPIPGKL